MGRGANVNEVDLRNDDKFTPLHWAAHAGSLEVSSRFLLRLDHFSISSLRKVYALAFMESS